MDKIVFLIGIILVELCFFAKGQDTKDVDPTTKIVGGELADIRDFPYQVSIRVFDHHICGGSILDSTTILTAAHCTKHYEKKNYSIRLGNTDRNRGTKYNVDEIYEHPEYNKTIISDNDVAVIKVSTPIRFNQNCRPISMIDTGFQIAENEYVITSGWGVQNEFDEDSADLLRQVEIKIMSNYNCGLIYGFRRITKNMICALDTGKDSCQGDSGGPLVYKGKLCGVVSFGMGCARPGVAGVYANIATLRPWIEKYMKKNWWKNKSLLQGKSDSHFNLHKKGSLVRSEDVPNSVISGINDDIKDFPFQCSVRKQDQQICVATIFNSKYLICAGHCFPEINKSGTYITNVHEVTIRTRNGKEYKVVTVLSHSDYNIPERLNNDIAILVVSTEIVFDDLCKPIPLISAGEEIAAGTKCTVSHWGATAGGQKDTPNILKAVNVTVQSQEDCKSEWGAKYNQTTMMCCKEQPKDSCEGDSGGPLICNGVLAGIISFANTCTDTEKPAVYCKVSNFVQWSLDKINIYEKLENKIVGGEPSCIEDVPYQVSLRLKGKHYCGGVIIDSTTVLTAGHCVQDSAMTDLLVSVGNTNHQLGTEYKIAKIIIHPRYNIVVPNDYDLAVIKLDSSLTFCKSVQPIPLAECDDEIPEWCLVGVSGWGVTEENGKYIPEILRVTKLRTINNFQCGQVYGHRNITPQMMCALDYGKDTCQGDSGGPLTYKGKLYGIVSTGEGCAKPGYPGIYTKISKLRPWIEQYMDILPQIHMSHFFHDGDKIAGGRIADIKLFPYQASLRVTDHHLCGAVIITNNILLTAAHCVANYGANELSIRVGDTNNNLGEQFGVQLITMHPRYNNTINLDFDIAKIKLSTQLRFNSTVRPIALADPNIVIPEGAPLYISGWGVTKFGRTNVVDMLRAARIRSVPLSYCRKVYGDQQVTDNMMCARQPDAASCEGDSGGPLTWKGRLVGITSFNAGCTKPGWPGVYVNITSNNIYRWI